MQETSNQIQQLHSQIKTVQSDNQKLHEQLQIAREELQKRVSNSLAQSPVSLSTTVDTSVDMNSTRDRILAKLKMGRQSTAGKAIDAFIKELRHVVETASTAAVKSDLASITPKTDGVPPAVGDRQTVTTKGEQKPPTWEARADDFLKEVAGNG